MLLLPLHHADGAALCGGAVHRSSGGLRRPSLPLRLRRRHVSVRADWSPSPSSRPQLSSSSSSPSPTKPAICTADELHYAPVSGAGWRLALWRYAPPPEAPVRNHPLMLLSGVGTNAIGFDLSPGASFARHMSCQGFDTWIVEVRGAGLSMRDTDNSAGPGSGAYEDITSSIAVLDKQTALEAGPSQNNSTIDANEHPVIALDEPQLVTKLTDAFMHLAEALSGYLNESQLRTISANFFDRISKLLEDARLNEKIDEIAEKISGLLEGRQSSAVTAQIRDLSQRLVKVVEEGQRTVPQLFDLQERFTATIEDFQKQLDLIVTYNWDFDHYLEEDIPAAMEYIRLQSKTKDGKVLAIGHSMGGILLYAMLSKCGGQSGLAAIVTLASSVDYTTSNSSLKLLLPLADPAQALNVPVVPLGTLLAAAYPLASRPPYVLSWLNPQISAQDMMHPELFSKLVLNNFCTVPANVILQLTTAFREGGLRNRTGTFSYKDHLQECQVPVLALAGDQDLICPPEAVYETVKLIPQHMVTYKVYGKREGPHYAHYDLVGGRLAVNEVYPYIIEFLSRHDMLST